MLALGRAGCAADAKGAIMPLGFVIPDELQSALGWTPVSSLTAGVAVAWCGETGIGWVLCWMLGPEALLPAATNSLGRGDICA